MPKLNPWLPRSCVVGGLLGSQQFVDEGQHRDYVTGKIWTPAKWVPIASVVWIIFNRNLVQCPIRLILNGKTSKEIEWHCEYYVGCALMKRFESRDALAKEMGFDSKVLAKAFKDYHTRF
jgi:hypothetical protein